jgi:hypothetical protein
MRRLAVVMLAATAMAGCFGTPAAPDPKSPQGFWSIDFASGAETLSLAACNPPAAKMSLCSLEFTVDATGKFQGTWEQVLRIDGVLAPTDAVVTFGCTGTAATGLVSAVAVDGTYVGTATMSGRTVPITIHPDRGRRCES